MTTTTIVLDNDTYEVARFSQVVKDAVGVYDLCMADLVNERRALLKTETLIKTLEQQIIAAVKAELASAEAANTP